MMMTLAHLISVGGVWDWVGWRRGVLLTTVRHESGRAESRNETSQAAAATTTTAAGSDRIESTSTIDQAAAAAAAIQWQAERSVGM